MTENEEFERICKEAMARLKVGKTLFAEEHLCIDPKTYRKYCSEGNVPKKIWLKAIALATGEPEAELNNIMLRMFRALYERLRSSNS